MADQDRVDAFFGNDGSSSTKAPCDGHDGKLRPNVWSSDDRAVAHRIVQQYDQDHTLAPSSSSSIRQSQRHEDTTTAATTTPTTTTRGPSTSMSTGSCHNNNNHIDIDVDDDTDDPTPPPLRTIPKIAKRIHFIWLGSKPIPRYPDLDTMILPSSTSTSTSTTTATTDDDDDDDGDTNTNNKDDEPQKQWNGTMRSWTIHHPPSNGWSLQLWTEATLQQFHNQLTTTTTMMMNTTPSCLNNNNPSSSSSSSSSLATTIRAIYDYAISIQNYGMASDIARLELLYEYGGVYVDVDYYCMGNLEDLLLVSSLSSLSSSLSMQTEIEFFCGASNTGCVEINNGLIGCRRRHGLIEDMMKEIAGWWSTSRFTRLTLSNQQDNDDDEYGTQKEERFAANTGSTTTTTKTIAISPIPSMLGSFLDTDSLVSFQKAAATTNDNNNNDGRRERNYLTAMEVIEHTGPGLLTRIIFKRFRDSTSSSSSSVSSLVVFPSTTFHPLPNVERARLKVNIGDETEAERYARILRAYVVVGETKAVHLWGCSWL